MKRFLILPLVILLVACSQPAGAPLIGITSARSSTGGTQLSKTYTEAISLAGGIPVVIPTLDSQKEADAVLAVLDGIVFSGGEDIQPSWYGEDVLNETVHIDTLRDYSDSLLARSALSSGKPILAICRGEQLINVMLGGSLYQDIPSQVAGVGAHARGAMHRIAPEPGSVLAGLYGTDSLLVNSYHHQAVKAPAPGIRITARSGDGIVEAYETAQVLAFQFHPEKMVAQGDKNWLSLFEEFIRRCGKRKFAEKTTNR